MRMSVLIWNNAGHYNNLDQTNTLFLCEKSYASTFPNTSCLRIAHGCSRNNLLPLLFWTVYCECYTMFSTRFCYKQALCPAARSPRPVTAQSRFLHSFFCPAVNPRGCTDLHRIWTDKIDDGEFELPFNYLNPCFCLLLVVQIKKRFILCSIVSLQKPIAQ